MSKFIHPILKIEMNESDYLISAIEEERQTALCDRLSLTITAEAQKRHTISKENIHNVSKFHILCQSVELLNENIEELKNIISYDQSLNLKNIKKLIGVLEGMYFTEFYMLKCIDNLVDVHKTEPNQTADNTIEDLKDNVDFLMNMYMKKINRDEKDVVRGILK